MSTRVVHVNDGVPGAVYIGRNVSRRYPAKSLKGGLFANPFRADKWGREVAIAKYRESVTRELTYETPIYREGLIALRGKPLACWCRHDGEARTEANACHGDVLVELLDRYSDDELRAMGGQTS